MKILTSICLSLLFVACGGMDKEKTKSPVAVKVSLAEAANAGGKRDFTFISKPFKTTGLSFRVGGPVVGFEAQPGQFYAKGAVIAAIDDRDFVIRKQKAEAVFLQAEAEYKRIATLYERNNVSGSSYEKAKSDQAIARAAFETAANELEDTRLKAPFDGYVQEVNIERFQDVRPSQPVVTFIDLSKLKIEAYIPEDVAMEMRTIRDFSHSGLEFVFDAVSGQPYTVSGVDISKSTTANNISFLLTAILENNDGRLLGGMTGKMSLTLSPALLSGSVYIPQTGVCHRPGTGAYVWVLNPADNKVKSVPVEVGGLEKGNRVEILSGLSVGDCVVLTRHAFLSDNQVVTVQK